MEDSVITITGRGDIKVKPDVTRVELTLETLHDTYREAYEQAKSNADTLTEVMRETGLDPKLPKTTTFEIEKKTRSDYDKDKHYIGQVFIGFQLKHKVRIDLGMDNVLLHRVLSLVSERLKQAEIDLAYTVRDPHPTELELVARAVRDAKEKAEIMVGACGCKLGMVKSIDYAVKQIDIIYHRHRREIGCFEETAGTDDDALDVNPDDIEASDRVTIQWYITKADA
ncbi:MAG: SIMPL domain-containing protein [Prevotellaceae bacterium]|nr:SIMPL domain-containing protein [Prevotellaceae bacterium]